MEGGGQSQAAAARAALESQAKKANASAEEKADETMTARQRAMQNLSKTGAVSKREAAGYKGESQMSAAMKNLHMDEKPQTKVIPNWKQTGAQRAAYEEKKAMRAGGESQMSAAMKAFGGQLQTTKSTVSNTPPSTFVPTAHSGPPKFGTPTKSTFGNTSTPSSRTLGAGSSSGGAPAPLVKSGTTMQAGAAEAEEGVEKDLKLLIDGIKRLGVAEADGSIVATFGKIVDDEQLEQQLESLVGTLKAGRRRCARAPNAKRTAACASVDSPVSCAPVEPTLDCSVCAWRLAAACWIGRGSCCSRARTTRRRLSSSRPRTRPRRRRRQRRPKRRWRLAEMMMARDGMQPVEMWRSSRHTRRADVRARGASAP